MQSTDPSNSEHPEQISESSMPERLIFESELWMECPKGRY